MVMKKIKGIKVQYLFSIPFHIIRSLFFHWDSKTAAVPLMLHLNKRADADQRQLDCERGGLFVLFFFLGPYVHVQASYIKSPFLRSKPLWVIQRCSTLFYLPFRLVGVLFTGLVLRSSIRVQHMLFFSMSFSLSFRLGSVLYASHYSMSIYLFFGDGSLSRICSLFSMNLLTFLRTGITGKYVFYFLSLFTCPSGCSMSSPFL